MIATFAALLLAHALADFVFQTKTMVSRKRHPGILVLHGAIVLCLSLALIGRWDAWPLYGLAAAHLATDAAKVLLARPGLRTYLADQAAHLGVIIAVALGFPYLWDSGIWAALGPPLPGAMTENLPAVLLVVAGAIIATRAGGSAIGMLMSGYATRAQAGLTEGLPGAGEAIGLLERGLTFGFILLGQPEAVGFLLAAKSILRFGAIKEDRAASEYVLIGTLASFGWAILMAYAINALIAAT